MNVDNVENSKNDEKNVQTTATDQHAQRRKQQLPVARVLIAAAIL